MLNILRKLKQRGVLGINARNASYIMRYNNRRYYPLVDDKLKTKKLAEHAHIAVPPLYAVIKSSSQLRELPQTLNKLDDFVIKPAQGAGGDGIIVVDAQHNQKFRKTSGQLISLDTVEHHISNILSGMYSLGGHRDEAIIEYRVQQDKRLEKLSFQGVPDIRIIVFRGFPVMAMLRLPTRQSGGKANLHQGAIGVGIDLSTGITLNGVSQNNIINLHPDTEHTIKGFKIPHWEQCLDISSKCYELSQLGYLGVDIVLDEHSGPMMLELNARPGMNIQIANQEGLLTRLQTVEHLFEQMNLSPPERIAFAKNEFASKIQQERPVVIEEETKEEDITEQLTEGLLHTA